MNKIWAGPDSRVRWKRVILLTAILALCVGLVIGKPLLFPKPPPPEPPAPMPTVDIEYSEHFFDSVLGRYGVKSLGYLCNASSPDALRSVVTFPPSHKQTLLELHGDRLLKYAARFNFNNTETQANRVVSSISIVDVNDRRSIWQLVDQLSVTRPINEYPANFDGPSVDLEACRHGHYIPSIDIGRTMEPEGVATDIANKLWRLSGENLKP